MRNAIVIFGLVVLLAGAYSMSLPQLTWEDLRFPAASTQINPVSSKPDRGTFIGNIDTVLFDDNSLECVQMQVQLPHRYAYGTDLHPHVHWSPLTTNGGTVQWCLECYSAEINGVFSSVVDACTDDTADGTAHKHQVHELSTLSGSAVDSVSSMYTCRLCRNGGSDTHSGDAALLEFDIHYQSDTFGSAFEYSKR